MCGCLAQLDLSDAIVRNTQVLLVLVPVCTDTVEWGLRSCSSHSYTDASGLAIKIVSAVEEIKGEGRNQNMNINHGHR
jgi:hypothetical protein